MILIKKIDTYEYDISKESKDFVVYIFEYWKKYDLANNLAANVVAQLSIYTVYGIATQRYQRTVACILSIIQAGWGSTTKPSFNIKQMVQRK